MDGKTQPLWKALEAPLLSLDESYVELLSLLCLFLLALLALVARGRRRQWLRHLVQTASVLVFFFVVYSCLGVFGMVRNTVHGVGLIGSVFTESFFWMSLPLLVVAFSLTTGPYFCGWICPTGFFQELAAMAREYLSRLLRLGGPTDSQRRRIFPVFGLGLFFGFFLALIFCLGSTRLFYVEDASLFWGAALLLLVFLVLTRKADDAAIRALRGLSFAIIFASALLKTAIVSPVHFAFANVADPASALTTLVLVVASLFVSRAWCRYVCPWGWLMGVVHRYSRLRVEATGDCCACSSCADRCRVGAIRAGRVSHADCQFCLACVDGCPQRALEVVDVWRGR